MNQTIELTLRVILGPIALVIGCLLIYRYDRPGFLFRPRWRDRLLYGLGILLLALGLGAFFLPVYYLAH